MKAVNIKLYDNVEKDFKEVMSKKGRRLRPILFAFLETETENYVNRFWKALNLQSHPKKAY